MPFTTPALLRTHLLTATLPELVIENHPVTLIGTDPVELPHHNLVVDTVSVKWLADDTLSLESGVTLTDTDEIDLLFPLLVRGSVVVTLSEAVTTIYTEEVDYRIDYAKGRISRVDTGSVPNGQQVLVYYLYYTAFTSGTDYTLDHPAGILTRDDTGAIPDGANVLVDYTVTSGGVEDDLIVQSITEAEDIIVRFLSPDYNSSSTDQGLKTGATQLALSIICRAQAIEALSRRATTDIPGRAKEWQQLSRFYEQQAWDTLAPFLLPMHLRSTVRQTRDA